MSATTVLPLTFTLSLGALTVGFIYIFTVYDPYNAKADLNGVSTATRLAWMYQLIILLVGLGNWGTFAAYASNAINGQPFTGLDKYTDLEGNDTLGLTSEEYAESAEQTMFVILQQTAWTLLLLVITLYTIISYRYSLVDYDTKARNNYEQKENKKDWDNLTVDEKRTWLTEVFDKTSKLQNALTELWNLGVMVRNTVTPVGILGGKTVKPITTDEAMNGGSTKNMAIVDGFSINVMDALISFLLAFVVVNEIVLESNHVESYYTADVAVPNIPTTTTYIISLTAKLFLVVVLVGSGIWEILCCSVCGDNPQTTRRSDELTGLEDTTSWFMTPRAANPDAVKEPAQGVEHHGLYRSVAGSLLHSPLNMGFIFALVTSNVHAMIHLYQTPVQVMTYIVCCVVIPMLFTGFHGNYKVFIHLYVIANFLYFQTMTIFYTFGQHLNDAARYMWKFRVVGSEHNLYLTTFRDTSIGYKASITEFGATNLLLATYILVIVTLQVFVIAGYKIYKARS